MVKEEINLLLFVCPFRSLVAQHTIAKQQGTNIGRCLLRFYCFSTVAGGGPDLTEIMLLEIVIELVNCTAAVRDEKAGMQAATPMHSFTSKGTMFGQ